MKIQEAWNGLMKENLILKAVVFMTTGLAIVMGILALVFSQKAPVVIDRNPGAKMPVLSSDELSTQELEQLIKDALSERFDSQNKESNYLSDLQRSAREKEQTELSRNKMRQVVFVETINDEKNQISAEATRLILVGEIRSAFRFPLRLRLEKIGRSMKNPYGLLLTEVQAIKLDQAKERETNESKE